MARITVVAPVTASPAYTPQVFTMFDSSVTMFSCCFETLVVAEIRHPVKFRDMITGSSLRHQN